MTWLTALSGSSDVLAIIACLALLAATLMFIFVIEPDASDSAPHRTHLDQLMDQRDTVYDSLRDLKFEYRAGKFAEPDYEQMRDALENEAALVLAEMEAFTGSQVRRARRDPAPAPAGSPSGNQA